MSNSEVALIAARWVFAVALLVCGLTHANEAHQILSGMTEDKRRQALAMFQSSQPPHLLQDHLHLEVRHRWRSDQPNTPLPLWIQACPSSSRGVARACRVDPDGMVCLHPIGGALDHVIGGSDDVLCGAKVLYQVGDLAVIVSLESADELNTGLAKPIDVLNWSPKNGRHEVC